MTQPSKILGVGINDVYQTTISKRVNGKKVVLYICPVYIKWREMLKRCYCTKYQEKNPTYKECTMLEEWHVFSVFKKWVVLQDWEDKCLDKDLLVENNKHYSDSTCVFISQEVNKFLITNDRRKGAHLIGACLHKDGGFISSCSVPPSLEGKRYIGLYPTELEAHLAWKSRKHQYSCLLADKEVDVRIKNALQNKYK